MKDEDDKNHIMDPLEWVHKGFDESSFAEKCIAFVLLVLIGIIGAIVKNCC